MNEAVRNEGHAARARLLAHPALAPLWLALASRLLVAALTAFTLAMWYPRRNPASTPWTGDDLAAHTLLDHVARASLRGDWQRWLDRAHDPLAGGPVAVLYPLLVNAVHAAGAAWWVAGTIVATSGIVATAVLLHRCMLALPTCPFDGAASLRIVLLWLCVPTAALLGVIGPWSLLATLLAATWLAALRGRPLTAGTLAGLAALAHPAGLAALAPVAMARPASSTHPNLRVLSALLVAATIALGPLVARDRADAPRALVGAVAAHATDPARALQRSGAAIAAARADLTTRPVDLRATPTATGDRLSRAVLTIVGTLLLATIVLLVPAAWSRVDPGGAAMLAALAIALAGSSDTGVPMAAVIPLSACALPAVAAWGLRATHSREAFHLHAAVSASLFGFVVSASALWQWLGA